MADKKKRTKPNHLYILILMILCILDIFMLNVADLESLPQTSVINITLDVAGMLVGLVVLICCTIDEKKSNYEVYYFTLLLVINSIILFVDEVSWIIDRNPELRIVAIIDNTIYYILAPILALLFIYYVTDIVKEKNTLLASIRKLFSILLILDIAAVLLNLVVPVFFTVDIDGVYGRTPFYFLAYLYPFASLIACMIILIRHKNEFDKYQKVALYTYVVIPFAAGIFSMLVYGIVIMHPIIMLMILCVYCMFNVTNGQEMSRMQHDIKLAAKIQEDALPKKFPAFPDRNEFELYASMVPAKNIGGDFYDYFMIDEDHVAFLIADVSGKGVSAALFMMLAKALIRGNTTSWIDSPSDVLAKVNEQLCEKNDEMLFVTVWLGILTISTGVLTYANAGHENPTIYRAGGGFRYRKEKHSPPIGIIEDVSFENIEVKLSKGDMIFVYTDGITEARNINKEFYGDKRLLEALNKETSVSVDKIVKNVSDSINGFVSSSAQFDDITMLIFKYNGSNSIEEYVDDKITSLKVQATLENLDQVLDFIKVKLEACECTKGVANQIYIAVEEIYVNIARYAYKDRIGMAVIKAEIEEDPRALCVTFVDNGIKYNPLKREDPDVKLNASHRKIGGLGIFIVKKSMDYLYYEHRGGNNVFTIKKYLDTNEKK